MYMASSSPVAPRHPLALRSPTFQPARLARASKTRYARASLRTDSPSLKKTSPSSRSTTSGRGSSIGVSASPDYTVGAIVTAQISDSYTDNFLGLALPARAAKCKGWQTSLLKAFLALERKTVSALVASRLLLFLTSQ